MSSSIQLRSLVYIHSQPMDPSLLATTLQSLEEQITGFETDSLARADHLPLHKQISYKNQVRAFVNDLRIQISRMRTIGCNALQIHSEITKTIHHYNHSLYMLCEHNEGYDTAKQKVEQQNKAILQQIRPSPINFTPFSPKKTQDFPVRAKESHFPPIQETSYASYVEARTKKCEENINQVIQEIQQCPRAKKLWDEVSGAGKFSVVAVSHDDAPGGAQVDIYDRVIKINEHEKDINQLRKSLVFELSNLKRAEKGKEINKHGCKYPNEDAYAREIEKVEYSSTQEATEVLNACRENGIWPDVKPRWNFSSFDDYLTAQVNFGHTDHYTSAYLKQCKNMIQISNLK